MHSKESLHKLDSLSSTFFKQAPVCQAVVYCLTNGVLFIVWLHRIPAKKHFMGHWLIIQIFFFIEFPFRKAKCPPVAKRAFYDSVV